jgi:branched-chain amino acid transport system substrate-binding protein
VPWIACALALFLQPHLLFAEAPALLVGLTAELQHPTSAAGQSIRAGILAAIADVNAAGGVFPGSKLQLIERDDRGLPARSLDNFRELAAMPAMTAVFAGESARLGNEMVKAAESLKTPILIPWAGAEPAWSSASPAKFVFRLAMTERDSLSLMLQDARRRGYKRIGFLLPSNVWGRLVAREAMTKGNTGDSLSLFEPQWYETGAATLIPAYRAMLERGADAVILIANDGDSSRLLRDLVAMPEIPRLPVYLHWTALGGKSSPVPPVDGSRLDLNVVHIRLPDPRQTAPVLERIARQLPESFSGKLPVPSAALQAYDLTRLLAVAIARTETGNRVEIRNALVTIGDYRGVLRHYRNPYVRNPAGALSASDFGLFRLRVDGAVEFADGRADR